MTPDDQPYGEDWGEVPDEGTLKALTDDWGPRAEVYCEDCRALVGLRNWAKHCRWHVEQGLAAERAALAATVAAVERWLRAGAR